MLNVGVELRWTRRKERVGTDTYKHNGGILMDAELLYVLSGETQIRTPIGRIWQASNTAAASTTAGQPAATWNTSGTVSSTSFIANGMTMTASGFAIPTSGYYAVQARMTLANCTSTGSGTNPSGVYASTRGFIYLTVNGSTINSRSDEVYGNAGYYARNLADTVYLTAGQVLSVQYYYVTNTSTQYVQVVGGDQTSSWLSAALVSY